MSDLATGPTTGVTSGAPWHVGVIVEDLDEAMAQLTAVAGMSFCPPQQRQGEAGPFRLTFTQQPPYLELIEGTPGTLRDSSHGSHLHHLAFWTGQYDADLERLLGAGFRQEIEGTAPFGGRWCYLAGATSGVRVELCSSDAREGFFAKWGLAPAEEDGRTGSPPPGPSS